MIHVETMRGCGHAHHHDDLYLGSETGTPPGYVDRDCLNIGEQGSNSIHRELLLTLGISEQDLLDMESEEQERVDEARDVVEAMAWPEPETVTKGVTTPMMHERITITLIQLGILSMFNLASHQPLDYVESGGWTYARAIQQAMVDIAIHTAKIASSLVKIWKLQVPLE